MNALRWWKSMRPAPRSLVVVTVVLISAWLIEDGRGRIRLHIVERKWASRGWALSAEGALARSGGKRGAPTVVDAIREGDWDEQIVRNLRENTRRHPSADPAQQRLGPAYGNSRPIAAFLRAPLPDSPAEALALELSGFDRSLEVLQRGLTDSDIQGWDPYKVSLFGKAEPDHSMECAPLLPMYVLSVRAQLSIANRDAEAILAELKTMIAIANATRRPSLVSQDAINRFQTRRVILDTAWLSLRERIWDEDSIEEFVSVLNRCQTGENLATLALNDVVLLKEAWRRQDGIKALQIRRDLVHRLRNSPKWGSLTPADVQDQLKALRDLIVGWILPPGAFDHWFAVQLDRLAEVASRGGNLRAYQTNDATWWADYVPMDAIIPMRYPGVDTWRIVELQKRDLLDIAIGLEREFLRTGAYPAALPADSPRDRFWPSRPPRYERTPDGRILLYSVGENRRNDGGDPRADIVWRYSPR